MRSNTARVMLGIAVLAVAVLLFVVLKDDNGSDATDAAGRQDATKTRTDKEKPTKPPLPVVAIEGGKPVGGVLTLNYKAGDRIRFKVRSNVADEVHVHGYDLSKDVEAGGTVAFDFPATIEGVFEAELEERGEQILELRVNP